MTLSGDNGLQVPSRGDLLVLASTVCFASFIVLAAMAAWGTAAVAAVSAVEL